MLLILTRPDLAAQETNAIAISEWSEPVDYSADGKNCALLRGRILILEGRSPAHAGKLVETQVYLELQNVSTSVTGPMLLYFDPREGMKCELQDALGRPAPEEGSGGSGSFPSACWITLPYDSTTRLRTSWYGYGMAHEYGLMIPLFHPLTIRANNTNDYYLSGTFTVTPPTNRVSPLDYCVWRGTLNIPKTKIQVRRP